MSDQPRRRDLFVSLPLEEFLALPRLSPEELQAALDRGAADVDAYFQAIAAPLPCPKFYACTREAP